MLANNKLIKKGKRIYQNFIDNLGRKNYEKIKQQKPEDYVDQVKDFKLIKLLQNTHNKKLDEYRNYKIPMRYIPHYHSGNPSVMGVTNGTFEEPDINFYLPITKTMVDARNTIGHELGHAKNRLNIYIKMKKIKEKYKNNPDKLNTALNEIKNKYFKTSEAIADKNISTYLKQMNIPKNERRAHYRLHKDANNPNGRYQSRFGNLKYLKDYIFGFSEETI